MAGTIYSRFFWQDWAADPNLYRCSAGAQALWMRMLCLAAQSATPGHVLIGDSKPTAEDLAHNTGFALEDVKRWTAELVDRRVCDLTREGTMVSRRMIKDARKHESSVKGGKSRQKHRLETAVESGGSSRTAAQPPLARVQSPESTSQKKELLPAPSFDEKVTLLARLGTAIGRNLDTDRNAHTHFKHIIDFRDAGLDFDLDVIPCIEQMRDSGRQTSDKSIAYFLKPALTFREARLLAAAVEVELVKQTQAKIAAMTEAQWTRHVLWWLFLGEWPEELGAPPLQVGCRAPIEARVIRNLFKKLDEKPYARRQKNCSLLVPFAWPDHQSPATMCSEPELADMQVFLRGGSDLRLEWWAKAVTAEEARAIFAKYDPPKRQVV